MQFECPACKRSIKVPDGRRVVCSCGQKHNLPNRGQCRFRGHEIGKAECNCGGKPTIYRCELLDSYCSPSPMPKPLVTLTCEGLAEATQLRRKDVVSCGSCDQWTDLKNGRHLPTRPATTSMPTSPVACDVVIPYCAVDYQWVGEAVQSILDQVHATPTIHVVADGPHVPDVTLPNGIRRYRSPESIGPYRIANALAEYFETEFVALQDADDTSEPDRLWKQIATLKERDCHMISGGMVQFIDQNSLGDDRLQEQLRALPVLRSGIIYQDTPRGACINSVKTFRRSAFLSLRGFMPWPMSADFEFDNRVAHASMKIFHASDLFGRRRLHSKSLCHGAFLMGSQERAKYARLTIERLTDPQPGGIPDPVRLQRIR